MTADYTLLTIEDEEPIRISIRAFFEDSGFKVIEAENGEEGLLKFRKAPPDVVLVDLRMPGLSGLDVIDILSREAPDIPIVVLSGTGVIADAIHAIRKGAWDFVTKPVKEMAELEHVVQTVLERARLRMESKKHHERLEEEVSLRTKALRESEERYRNLVENMSDAIYVLNEDGTVTYVSPGIEKITGYTPQEIMGRDFRAFFHPETFHQLTRDFENFIAGRRSTGEHVMVKKSGEEIWVRSSSHLIWKEGRPAGIQGILTNIMDLKNVELQLKSKARELEVLNRLGRDLGENPSIDAIVNTVLKVTVSAVAPDLAILFLRKGKDLFLKGLLPEEQGFPKGDIPLHRAGECLCGIAAEGEKTVYSKDIHTDYRCTNDECKNAGFRSFAALPLKSEGVVIGVLGVAAKDERDFQEAASFLEPLGNEAAIGLKNAILIEKAQTDAVELQTRLAQIQEAQKEKEELTQQLHRAQKMEAIGTLAGGIAHDFNNVLTPIMMGTEFVLMSLSGETESRRMLNRVLNAVSRAKELVNQILTFSRQGDLEKNPISVGPILKETLKLARAALPSTIEIREDISGEKDVILANPTQMHQLIMNLITNAAHAMRLNGGVLEISLRSEVLDESAATHMRPPVTPGPFLKLMVRDSGHGMDSDTLEKIFDPFFTTKKRGEGTGMGLSTVHGIVGACGGVIQVESEPGKGSLFTIYLPGLTTAGRETVRKHKVIPRGAEQILFVDDEPMIGDIYADMLRPLGYKVECRTDPLDTLEAFRKDPFKYDLVITDMTMPKMTGDKLGAEIMEIRPEIPVILCTGFSERMSEEKALELGFCSFVMKPVVIEEIANKIRRALDGVNMND
jgi:PAS domain S-box-containing protein